MIRGRRGPRGLALALATALALASLPAPAQLPTLGDGNELTLAAERRIGERIAREIYRDPDYIDDAVLGDYVQSLWQPLLAAARERGDMAAHQDQRFAWEVLLDRERSINAFALPGGWMGLNLGLVAGTANRDELASVLAHELSHVTQRHIARMMAQDQRTTPLMVGAMLLGVLAASRSPNAANALIVGGQAAAVQGQLNFSRDMEREADRIGFGVHAQAGFNSQGFAGMFEKLQQAARLNDSGAFPYLRTHPLTLERMADMRARVPLGDKPAAPAPDLEHAMMAARARVLMAEGADGLRRLVQDAQALAADAGTLRQAGSLYAGALAASRLRDPSLAQRLQARLASVVPATGGDRPARAVRLLGGELALATGDATRALAAFAAGRDRSETLMGAQAALLAKRPDEAAQRLQTWVVLHPGDGTAWQQLSMAQSAQGQSLRAIRSDAEARMAWLDYGAALDRFKAAQEMARRSGSDHFEASIIDSRAREVESRVREQALER